MKKLHLGCGQRKLNGWVNIDIDGPAADYKVDLRKPLRFDSGSISHIFSEHFIEHLTLEEGYNLLVECWRILVPGGFIRLATPNLSQLVRAYHDKAIRQWGDLWMPLTPCRMLNEAMRSWGHQFVYDAAELEFVLEQAGFANACLVQSRESEVPEFIGLETRPFTGEIIMEAQKPA